MTIKTIYYSDLCIGYHNLCFVDFSTPVLQGAHIHINNLVWIKGTSVVTFLIIAAYWTLVHI